jgi:hypothetical protein
MKCGQHGRLVDPRKSNCVILVGGKLERRNATCRKFWNGAYTVRFRDGALERHVDMGGAVNPANLSASIAASVTGLGTS